MTYPSRNKQIVVLIAVVAIASVLGVIALNYIFLYNGGNVKAIGVGVYWDSSCTSEALLIDWGIVEPGTTEDVTFYIRNEGNSDIMLSMNTTNWSPLDASNYIALSWDYRSQSIVPATVLPVTLTLSMSSSVQAITSFSFDIVVTGIG